METFEISISFVLVRRRRNCWRDITRKCEFATINLRDAGTQAGALGSCLPCLPITKSSGTWMATGRLIAAPDSVAVQGIKPCSCRDRSSAIRKFGATRWQTHPHRANRPKCIGHTIRLPTDSFGNRVRSSGCPAVRRTRPLWAYSVSLPAIAIPSRPRRVRVRAMRRLQEHVAAAREDQRDDRQSMIGRVDTINRRRGILFRLPRRHSESKRSDCHSDWIFLMIR